jgi:uncharacterized RDD family membrane protein YckC
MMDSGKPDESEPRTGDSVSHPVHSHEEQVRESRSEPSFQGNLETGSSSQTDESAKPISGEAIDVRYRDVVQAALPPGAIRIGSAIYAPAGFALRLRAFLIDFVVLLGLGTVLMTLVDLPQPDHERELVLSLHILKDALAFKASSPKLTEELAELRRPLHFSGWLNVALCAAYFILFHGLVGSTPGKAACGLRVLLPDGKLSGIGKATLRYLVYFLTAKLAYGTFTMPFDAQRRALHDIAAGCNVYRQLRWR